MPTDVITAFTQEAENIDLNPETVLAFNHRIQKEITSSDTSMRHFRKIAFELASIKFRLNQRLDQKRRAQ
jgi:hypothetical protein